MGVVVGRVDLDRPLELTSSLFDPRRREIRAPQRLVQRRLRRLPLDCQLQHLGSAAEVAAVEALTPLGVQGVDDVVVVVRHAHLSRPLSPHSTIRERPTTEGSTAPVVDAAPFRALRYDTAIAGDPATTSAPAYDDLGRFQYAQHRTASPYTVLELLAGAGDDQSGGYESAGAAYRRWLRTGVLVEHSHPAFYLYEIHELRRAVPAVLRGVLAAVAVTGDTLLPHERVESHRIENRLRRLAAVPADLAPVFAVHTAAGRDFRDVVDAAPHTPPLIAFTDEVGADHRIWPVTESDAHHTLAMGLRGVRAVIADGHHRFAAAVELQRLQPQQRRTLTYLVDATAYGPQLLPVHRVATRVPRDLARRLREVSTVTPVPIEALEDALAAVHGPALGWRTAGDEGWLLIAHDAELVRRMPRERSTAWRRLDTAVFEYLVRPVLGDAEITYRAGDGASQGALRPGSALFLVRPPPLETVYSCALEGEAMPAKSTWFRPKPRAGVVMRSLDSGT
ncbi:MAG: DUF1015 family protein [Nitriliruptorales bacterium]|nr:DUF1015 family protein [Nitriliruptorales bacterium]